MGKEPRLPLSIDQLTALVAQLLAFAVFIVLGAKADQALDGQIDLATYRAYDRYSAVALVILAVLWLYGVGRAVHRRSGWQLAVFAVAVPAMFGAFAVMGRLTAG